jgi:hypothetical protein
MANDKTSTGGKAKVFTEEEIGQVSSVHCIHSIDPNVKSNILVF